MELSILFILPNERTPNERKGKYAVFIANDAQTSIIEILRIAKGRAKCTNDGKCGNIYAKI